MENSIELDLFNGLGLGETHVLTAIKYATSLTKKKNGMRYFVICRDWCGAYCNLVLNADSLDTSSSGLSRFTKTNLKSKKRVSRIIAAYPLILEYEIELLEIKNNLNRFNLILDGEAIEMVTDVKQKDKLEKYLQYAYMHSTHQCATDTILLSIFHFTWLTISKTCCKCKFCYKYEIEYYY